MSHISSWIHNIPSKKGFRWNKKTHHWCANPKSAVLTAGGNCPGINHTLSCLRKEINHDIIFFKNGFQGLNQNKTMETIPDDISDVSGSVIGMSRSMLETKRAASVLLYNGITNLYAIGGNGTANATHELHKFITKHELPICVNVIPKTIDNDIPMVERSFGFHTAVERCSEYISFAYNEAKTNSEISIIQLMGRNSGQLALHSAYGSNHFDILLIPEAPYLPDKLFTSMTEIYRKQGHLTIVIAEGYRCELKEIQENANYITQKHKLFQPGYLCRNSSPSAHDKMYIKNLVKYIVYASEEGYGGFCIEMKKEPYLYNLDNMFSNKESPLEENLLNLHRSYVNSLNSS